MKEAAGEANMTVITIILIGIVAAIAYPMIKGIMEDTEDKSDCVAGGGIWDSAARECSNWDGNSNN